MKKEQSVIGKCGIPEIPEFEEKLKKIEELKEKIKNPEPGRLLTEHRNLEKQLKNLSDAKVSLYEEIKGIIKSGCQLLQRKDNKWVCYFKGNHSEAGHPKIYYFRYDEFLFNVHSTSPITTSRDVEFKEFTPKEFMDKLMSGEGFMPSKI